MKIPHLFIAIWIIGGIAVPPNQVSGRGSEPVLFLSSTEVTSIYQAPRPFDRFGDVPLKEERIRLDNFAVQLRRESGTKPCIIVCGKPSEAQKRADRAKSYLENNRGIRNVTSSHNCVRPKLEFELYIVRPNSNPPAQCSNR